MSSFIVKKVYLGATLDYYSQEFQTFISKLHNAKSHPTEVICPTKDAETTSELLIFVKDLDKPRYMILPALQWTQKDQTNDASLVVRVQYDTHVSLLTGDATKKTTSHILHHLPGLKAATVQASHHGSCDEGCNEEAWIKTLDPQCIIISSGLKHLHPREEAIENFLQALPAAGPHDGHRALFYGATKNEEDRTMGPCVLYENGYATLSTNKNLFGTLRHGNVRIGLKKGAPLVITTNALTAGTDSNKKMSSLHSCLSLFPEVFSTHHLAEVHLTNLNFDDKTLVEKNELITQFTSLDTCHPSALKALLLAGNSFSQKETADALETLIRRNRAIRRTTITKAPLPVGAADAIELAWGNRGLELS